MIWFQMVFRMILLSSSALDDPEREAVRVFTMNLSKAFDSVKHGLLSEMLKRLRWIRI